MSKEQVEEALKVAEAATTAARDALLAVQECNKSVKQAIEASNNAMLAAGKIYEELRKLTE